MDIDQLPSTVRLLNVSQGAMDFCDYGEYEAMVTAAAPVSKQAHVIVLLSGDAGLPSGEMRALE